MHMAADIHTVYGNAMQSKARQYKPSVRRYIVLQLSCTCMHTFCTLKFMYSTVGQELALVPPVKWELLTSCRSFIVTHKIFLA